MEKRIEYDSLGPVEVDASRHWGAQTQRSLENFRIGGQRQPESIIRAFACLKAACAGANLDFGKLGEDRCETICAICEEIAEGRWAEEFPLVVWQTGSGTQTNMNLNEVIAHLAAERGVTLHPNDHVNMSQSSNDTFPSAMRIAAVTELENTLLPSARRLSAAFAALPISTMSKPVASGSSVPVWPTFFVP